jgi:predicted CXXCH cytochrome family protein
MKINKIMMAAMAAGAVLLLPAITRAGIVNSVHDFTTTANTAYWISGKPWNAASTGKTNNACGSCHTIHHAPDPARGPLWIHTPTTRTFKYYSSAISESFPSDVSIASLGSSSLSCLGCHDGSVAVNSQDSGALPNTMTTIKGGTSLFIASNAIPIEVTGGQDDLTHMHPIGVSYSACVASPNLPPNSLNAVGTPFVGASGATVASQLKAGNVECSSCHDIHRTIGNSMNSGIFTIASGQNLCLGCHNK